MKQEKLIEVIREMIIKLSFLLEKTNQDFGKNALQDLRSCMKKFRDFLQMLQLHVGDDNLEMPRSLKQLYYIAGKSLHAYTEIDTLQLDIAENADAIEKLHKDIQQYASEWKKHYSPKTLPKLQSKLTNVKYDSVPTVALSNFFNVHPVEVANGEHEPYFTIVETDVIRRHIYDIIIASEISKKSRSLVS